MAHHLIALLFSSAQYMTSPCMKPTHSAHHHHTPEILSSPLPSFLPRFHLFQCKCDSVYIFLFFLVPLKKFNWTIELSTLFFSLCYLCFCPLLFVCMCLLQWIPTPCYFPFLAGSLFSADVPLVSSGLAGRQQKWLWDWGMAAVLSLTHRTTLNSLWPHTCRAERRVRQQESNEMKTWQRATNLFAEIK